MTSHDNVNKRNDLNGDVINRKLPHGVIEVELRSDETVQLKRTIGLLGGVSFIVGAIIGSGIFISAKGVVIRTGSYGVALIIWAVAGLISMCFAFTYSELGTILPRTGGAYMYLNEGIHPVVAFMKIFTDIFVSTPGGVAIASMTSAKYVLSLFFEDGCGEPPSHILKMLAVVLGGIATYINIRSATAGKHVQIIFTASKVLVLLIIIVGGLAKFAQGSTNHLQRASTWTGAPSNLGDIILGLYGCLFAYGGWDSLNFLLGELTDPLRKLPLAILISMPLVTAVYLLTNISYFVTIPIEEFKSSPAVASTWANYVIPNFNWIIPIGVGMSTYGALNGKLFRAGRLHFAVARKGQLPKIFTMLQVHSCVPQPGILISFIFGVLMIIPSSIEVLLNMVVFADMIFQILVFSVCIRWRWTEGGRKGSWRAPLLLPYWALIFAILIVLVPVTMTPSLDFMYGALAVLSGLVFYVPFIHYKLEIPGMGCINTYFQLLCEVCPPNNDETIAFEEKNY